MVTAPTAIDVSNTAAIGVMKQGQQIQKAMMDRLLGSLPQQGQMQTPARSVDRVQISSEAYQRLAAEEAQRG
jgi:hypothetical protein